MSQKPRRTASHQIFQILGGITSPNPDFSLSGTVDNPGVEESPGAALAVSSDGTVSPSLDEQIVSIEQKLESLKHKPIEDLDDDLKSYAKGALESANTALSSAHYAIVYAWATGRVLNLAKDILGQGQFGRWRDAKASDLGISVRRAQMWMKMARDCWDVRALLVPGASLTATYRAAGILPSADPLPPGQDDAGRDGDSPPTRPTPSATERAFAALGEGRKRLRHLIESAGILDEGDRNRLEMEKADFIILIDKLLYPLVP